MCWRFSTILFFFFSVHSGRNSGIGHAPPYSGGSPQYFFFSLSSTYVGTPAYDIRWGMLEVLHNILLLLHCSLRQEFWHTTYIAVCWRFSTVFFFCFVVRSGRKSGIQRTPPYAGGSPQYSSSSSLFTQVGIIPAYGIHHRMLEVLHNILLLRRTVRQEVWHTTYTTVHWRFSTIFFFVIHSVRDSGIWHTPSYPWGSPQYSSSSSFTQAGTLAYDICHRMLEVFPRAPDVLPDQCVHRQSFCFQVLVILTILQEVFHCHGWCTTVVCRGFSKTEFCEHVVSKSWVSSPQPHYYHLILSGELVETVNMILDRFGFSGKETTLMHLTFSLFVFYILNVVPNLWNDDTM